ncbi:MAG: Hpt domain protein [Gemmatimonadetes bacterium]|nr:Hpt domain protein [Gemmatimonadota bacterium]
MSGAAGFFEFFILEASDYVEQLDGLLLGGGSTGPDADAVQRVARALRGTATMAKMPSFAELASSVERVGRAIQEGAVQWNPAIGGALTGAIDDLKTLLHSARTWSAADDQRASARAAELSRFAPAKPPAATPAAGTASSPAVGSSFLATEAANIAAGLELLTTRAGDPETAANVLRRVRALRGVAGVKEVAPLADTLEGTEEAARGLESGEGPMSAEARTVLESAAAYLRALSAILRSGADVNGPSAERDAFTTAHEAWSGREGEPERVVPISDLFYADGAPGVVETSPNPPTSASQRFRLELVSLGEHLRQVVDGARRATDAGSNTRARRDLRRALHALQAAAESFGERDVANFIGSHVESTEHIDFLGLAALEDLASLLAEPGAQGERLSARLREIVGNRDLTDSIGAGFGNEEPAPSGQPLQSLVDAMAASATVATAPAPVVEPPRTVEQPRIAEQPRAREVLDSSSAALIDSTIAALDSLESMPFSEPVHLPEDDVVPIESLLYRGRSALDRAVAIRDELRAAPAGNPAALEELFDLLELARAE